MTDNKNKCKRCGDICNHDDDGYDICRFCAGATSNSDDSFVQDNIGENYVNDNK